MSTDNPSSSIQEYLKGERYIDVLNYLIQRRDPALMKILPRHKLNFDSQSILTNDEIRAMQTYIKNRMIKTSFSLLILGTIVISTLLMFVVGMLALVLYGTQAIEIIALGMCGGVLSIFPTVLFVWGTALAWKDKNYGIF